MAQSLALYGVLALSFLFFHSAEALPRPPITHRIPATAYRAVSARAGILPPAPHPIPLNMQLSAPTDNLDMVRGVADLLNSRTGSAAVTAPLTLNIGMGTSSRSSIVPLEFGTAGYPYSTRGAFSLNSSAPTNSFPWRATGKLTIHFAGQSFYCTASTIKPGVLVTAAHCVMDFGSNKFPTLVYFEPAAFDGIAPYGRWEISSVTLPRQWVAGTDKCRALSPGIVCENDLAVLTVHPNGKGKYVGDVVGHYAVGTNGYGSVRNFLGSVSAAQLTHLGYPVSHEGGKRMIRTDALAIMKNVNQMESGSAQGQGSSGGPFIVNFGADYQSVDAAGSGATGNVVIGVMSWLSGDTTYKYVGASRFGTNSGFTTTTNIAALLKQACGALRTPNARRKVCG